MGSSARITAPEQWTASPVETLSRQESRQCGPGAQRWPVSADELCQGLRRNQLRLAFQPMVPLRRSLSACFEVRGHLRNSRGTVAWKSLRTAAAARGLAEALDQALIRSSLAWLRKGEFNTLVLIVNLSLAALHSKRFAPWLASQLQDGPHPRNRLVLQFYEADLQAAPDSLPDFCAAISELQMTLAIRHFSASDDSFPLLSRFPFTQVTLDPARLGNLEADQGQFAALEALIKQLHAQHIKVAAGQVTSLKPLPLLWQAGVDFIQGRGLQAAQSRPILRCVCERVFAGPEATN